VQRLDVLSAMAALVTPQDLVVTWRSTTWDDWRELAPAGARNTLPLAILGSVSTTALGLAIALPHRRVVAVESDGSVLMNAGAMATLGAERPPNLTVVVLDNGMYESIGGPPTLTARHADLARMAEGAGCPNSLAVEDRAAFEEAAARLLDDGELGYLVTRIEPGRPPGTSRTPPTRPLTDGAEDKYRFLRYVEELEAIVIHPDPGPGPGRDGG
jgi:thiamine pyrophosphate-dependent acetolactate synthase large subunit-like protein